MKRYSTKIRRGLGGGRSPKLRGLGIGRWVGRCTTVYSHSQKEAEWAVSIQRNTGNNGRMLLLPKMLRRMLILLRMLLLQRMQRMLLLQRMQRMVQRML